MTTTTPTAVGRLVGPAPGPRPTSSPRRLARVAGVLHLLARVAP